ncbi:hypothetical protein FGB62_61g187 [Gracilaria domingensis]|nr:hypothetical protein FGB62_61g187 [Gracilaria domingensis]
MSRNAAVVDDDNDIVVVETVQPNPARDRLLPRDNVIVLDTSRPRPTRTTTSSIEPIVIDEAPRKRRRRDQSSHSPSTTAPVSHPPHVIIVDDSDSPPIRPSVLAFRGRETQTTRVNPPRIHVHPRIPSSSPYEEDIIEMAVSGPRLAPVRSPPPPPNLGPGNQPFLVEPILSVTPLSPPHTQRQSLPPLPELISPPRASMINSSPPPLRTVAAAAAPSEAIAVQQLELPSIPTALNQSAPQPNPTQQYASRLVDIDQILTRNPRMSAHRARDSDATRVTSALRASIAQPVHSHRHPLRHAPSVPRRYVHLERDQVASLGEVPTPAFVRASSSRRQHASPSTRPSRYGAQYEPRFTSFFLSDEAHLSPLQRHHQSDASQFSPDSNNALHPLEGLARSRYAGVAPMNAASSDIPSSTPESARLFPMTRSHSRRHAQLQSDLDELSGLRHIQRRRELHRTRPSSRRTTTTRPVMRASISSLANAQTTTMYDERVRRQTSMRSRARAYARPTFAQSTLHRHSAPHHIAAVVRSMMHQAGGTPGLEIHYLHGFHGDHSLDYEHLIRLDEQLIREKNRADNDQIESLPVHKATAEDKEIRCCICMCDVEEGEELRVLPCAHKYHKSCIDGRLSLSYFEMSACACSMCFTSGLLTQNVLFYLFRILLLPIS